MMFGYASQPIKWASFRTSVTLFLRLSLGLSLNLILLINLHAQDVQILSPEVVSEKNGYLAIQYDGLIPIAIKAIQEQHVIIASQEERIVHLEAIVQELMVKSK